MRFDELQRFGRVECRLGDQRRAVMNDRVQTGDEPPTQKNGMAVNITDRW